MWKFRHIRSKLWLSASLLLLLGMAVGGAAFFYVRYIAQYDNYRSESEQLNAQVHRAYALLQTFLEVEQRNEHYMETGKSRVLFEYEKVKQEGNQLLARLAQQEGVYHERMAVELGVDSLLERMTKEWRAFDKTFVRLQERVKERGYVASGAMGQMHIAARKLNLILKKQDTLALPLFEKMRRYEKDFFLKKDARLIRRVEKAAQELEAALPASMSPVLRLTVKDHLNDYLQAFNRVVALEKQIGLNEDSGLRAEAKQHMIQLHNDSRLLAESTARHIDTLWWRAKLIFASVLLILLLVGVGVALYQHYAVARPIGRLNKLTTAVTENINNEEAAQALAEFDDETEVGDIARNFSVMVTKLKASVEETKTRDEKLAEYIREEAKRKWAAEGLAIFGEILRSNYNDLERQSYEIISTLVEYTECQMGALFIVEDDEEPPYLELKASYAYGRPKYLKKKVAWGEGIVGAAWREGDKISLTDIPEDYPKVITGSLIEGKPKHVLVVPLQSDTTGIVGVIELASIRLIEEDKIDFIERLSSRIASTIAAVRANERNAKLLEASRKYAEELKNKEKELEVKVQQYDQWIRELEKKLNAIAEEAHIYRSIINRIYEGIILTNERFIITKVNRYVLKRFGYRRTELEGQPVDILIETNYNNIIDLRHRRFQLNYKSFTQNVTGKVIDSEGKMHPVQMMAGKLEIDTKIVYVFLFNEVPVGEEENINITFIDDDSTDNDDAIRI
ncbi:PAS domain S-box-containing protein [Thermonema lapsum]|uniref:PAS domain S-box-containing protein n=1 Tax=Thermonema lapsum TaxID=28195 RepID=A0A846MR97_9BACT|nr:GAF domain-containing protein [Thermonema lapsum]NIK73892.1 PAS domain S-box-containing protein [Thermonema lapsum]